MHTFDTRGHRARAGIGLVLLLGFGACGGGDDGTKAEPDGTEGPSSAAEPGSGGSSGEAPPPPPTPRTMPTQFQSPWLDPAWVAALPEDGPGLVDEAAARGLTYRNLSGEPHKPTILEANGAGVAAIDLESDGDMDLVFGQGAASLAALLADGGAPLSVFRNTGAGRFEEAPDATDPAHAWWTGLATGDLDGDGDADLVAGGFGALAWFAQDAGRLAVRDLGGVEADVPASAWLPLDPAGAGNGDGGAREPGLAPPLWTTSLALLDAELDGDLDLFVGRYLELDPARPPRGELGEGALAFPCWWKGIEVYCGPRGMTPQPDRVFRGDGLGGFEDATDAWLADQALYGAGFTLAVGAFDADFDGDSDLYVANDSTANLMLVNEVRGGDGFVDRALTAGVAVNPDGLAEAGMGVAFGDVDRNGRMDLAVTNFSDEPTHLYVARERGFGDQTYKLGLQHASRRFLSWSVHLEDFDGDGWLELFTANGHVYPQADGPSTGTRYAQEDTLWRVFPDRPVERVLPARRDSALAHVLGTRGSAIADFDNDGAPDLVCTTVDGPAVLAMNRMAPEANRLVLVLTGDPDSATESPDGGSPRRSTRDGVGAKAILVLRPPGGTAADEVALLKESQTAVGYQSASAPHLFFGSGAAQAFVELRILWPSGYQDTIEGGAMNRRLFIREGQGVVEEEEL